MWDFFLAITTVDLDKELAPHGLSLTFDDVQLVIGILYCVGTVEISSQRVESLLLIAQVCISLLSNLFGSEVKFM